MKNKITKIWGIALTLVLLIGLLVPAATPVPAAASVLLWSTETTPDANNLMFIPGQIAAYGIAPDGKTMYAARNVATTLGVAPAVGAITLTVVSTAGFASSGKLAIAGATPEDGISYTGTTATTFTGIPAAGPGSVTLGTHIVGEAVQAAAVYKSSDGGVNWTATGFAGTGGLALALAVSTDYANDQTVIVGNNMRGIYRSIDGGLTFGLMPAIPFAAGNITSVAVGPHYLGGQSILVGVSTGATGGGMARFTTIDFTWQSQVFPAYAPGTAARDVLAVAFSPKHRTDAQILAVTVDTAPITRLETRFVLNAWNADIVQAPIGPTTLPPGYVATGASIAFPADYDWSSMNRVLVGTSSVAPFTAGDDVFRIHGALAPNTSIAYDLNVSGTSIGTTVSSIAFRGNIADGNLVVGQVGQSTVWRATVVTSNNITFTQSTKATSGVSPMMVYSAIEDKIYGMTTGAGAALNVSRDSGNSFNQASLIAVFSVTPVNSALAVATAAGAPAVTVTAGAGANFAAAGAAGFICVGGETVRYTAVGGDVLTIAVPGLTATHAVGEVVTRYNVRLTGFGVIGPNWWAIYHEDTNNSGTVNAGDWNMLFKSTDKGITWERVLANQVVANEFWIGPIPAGTALFVPEMVGAPPDVGSTRVWRSTDSGSTWTGFTTALGGGFIAAFGPIDADNWFVGSTAPDSKVYKSGRFTGATLDGEVAFTINRVDATLLYVGTTGGDVFKSTDDGVTFTRLGPNDSMAGRVSIARDPGFATNKILYASNTTGGNAAGTKAGVYRWVDGTSSTWEQLFNSNTTNVVPNRVSVTPGGNMYIANMLASGANMGVYRQLNPAAPLADLTDPAKSPFESMNNALLTGIPTNAGLINQLSVTSDNTVYAVAAGVVPSTNSAYPLRVYSMQDTLGVAPEINAPKANVQIDLTTTFSWKPITSPVTLTYELQISTDNIFSNYVTAGAVPFYTNGTSAVITFGLTGQQLYWRVRVRPYNAGVNQGPMASKFSAPIAITTKLGTPSFALTLLTPSPDRSDAVSIRPVFTWSRVDNAGSYELEVADNPFFANAQAKKPLTNTVWAWDKDLAYSTSYYWRVRAISAGTASNWVQAAFTTIAEPVKPPPPTTPPPPPKKWFDPQSGLYFDSEAELKAYQTAHPPIPPPVPPSTPAYIWVIIVIAAILVIAVIVLIARTRRV